MLVERPKLNAVYAKGSKPIMERVVDPAHEAELANAMGNRAKRMSAALQRHMGAVEESISPLDKRVDAAVSNSRRDPTLDGQIRSYVAALRAGKRMSFLQQACQDKDLELVSAVLSSNPLFPGSTARRR